VILRTNIKTENNSFTVAHFSLKLVNNPTREDSFANTGRSVQDQQVVSTIVLEERLELWTEPFTCAIFPLRPDSLMAKIDVIVFSARWKQPAMQIFSLCTNIIWICQHLLVCHRIQVSYTTDLDSQGVFSRGKRSMLPGKQLACSAYIECLHHRILRPSLSRCSRRLALYLTESVSLVFPLEGHV
jgi:hypothetical protein